MRHKRATNAPLRIEAPPPTRERRIARQRIFFSAMTSDAESFVLEEWV